MDRAARLTRQGGYRSGTQLFTAFRQAMAELQAPGVAAAAPQGVQVDPQLVFLTDGEAGDSAEFDAARQAATQGTPDNFKALLVRVGWGL
jgi:hypothetical protein